MSFAFSLSLSSATLTEPARRLHEIADADMRELLGDVRIAAYEAHQTDGHVRQPLFALGAQKALPIKPAHISHPIVRRSVERLG